MNYIVFADESHITNSRFASLSALSLPLKHYDKLSEEMGQVLVKNDVAELKWNLIRDAKHYNCAQDVIGLIFGNLAKCNLRVDTLIWDHHDSRHTIRRRDDLANFERMFYHLLSNLIQKRPSDSNWHIRPDKRNGIDWETIESCLFAKGLPPVRIKEWPEELFFTGTSFNLESFKTVDSSEEVLIQIVDLFAGLAVYSRDKYPRFVEWKKQKSAQLTLDFFSESDPEKLSRSETVRMPLLDNFNKECKRRKLQVGLETTRGLSSYDSAKPINFWHYEPQGDYDQAPVKDT